MYIKNHPEICDVVADIASGMHDDNLEQIKAEFDTEIRRRQVAISLQEIAEGDRVEITAKMTPKFLTGLTGTVIERDGDYFHVKVDQDHPNLVAAKRTRHVVGIPVECVSKIEA
jgi:ribosomal protein L21E